MTKFNDVSEIINKLEQEITDVKNNVLASQLREFSDSIEPLFFKTRALNQTIFFKATSIESLEGIDDVFNGVTVVLPDDESAGAEVNSNDQIERILLMGEESTRTEFNIAYQAAMDRIHKCLKVRE